MYVLLLKVLIAISTIAGVSLISSAPPDKAPVTVTSDPYPGGCPPCDPTR